MNAERERPVIDVSELPTVVFGHRATIWMGNLGYMAIEGAMFLMVIVSYFYLRTRVNDWPPEQVPPALLWGTANLVLFLLSVAPNVWLKRQAHADNVKLVGVGLAVMLVIGVAAILLRVMEFGALKCRWDDNAYGSIIWTLVVLHSGHLLTEWIETLFLAYVLAAGHDEGHRLMDVEQLANYWYFVVLFEIALYLLVYVATRGM
jgi:cytochrome c oxidase subunit III